MKDPKLRASSSHRAARRQRRHPPRLEPLEKCPTGISGLDEITEGGLPRGRPTLVCGAAGCGKTLLAMEFIVRGIQQFKEPGVFMAFEETPEDLAKNVASLGFDLKRLVRKKHLAMDHVRVEPSEIEETGEYDLEGLFVRLGTLIDSVGAKRVVIDTLETLFSSLANEGIIRAELRRLFRWLKDRQVTAVITAEQGDGLTRHGLEEYVSDCVIVLDHRVRNEVATRRLRVIKYRGSRCGTNEYPTLIDEEGLSVLPINSLGLRYPVSHERISTGVPRLDTMLSGGGYYRGSTVLVSGTAGTGKTSLAVAFAEASCRRGEQSLYVSFEESPEQIIRNMDSIGYDLKKWVRAGRLRFYAVRPTLCGLEMHLATLHKLVSRFKPRTLVLDPITSMETIGNQAEVKSMLVRTIDFAKGMGITALFTTLVSAAQPLEQTEVGVSSLIDTWLLVKAVEAHGERNRLIYVLKSRGMAHSNQMREFQLTNRGIRLVDVYLGPGQVLTGSARLQQQASDAAQAHTTRQVAEQHQQTLRREQAALQAQAQALKLRMEAISNELKDNLALQRRRRQMADADRAALAAARFAD